MKNRDTISMGILTVVMTVWVIVSVAHGAILDLEDFSAGFGDFSTISRDGELVNLSTASGYLEGDFNTQIFPSPQTDAFFVNSGSSFIGDYVTPGITQISFQFNAFNVLPSDLFIRLIDGANTFTYQFNPVNINSWDDFVVDLAWSFGWSGPSELDFNNALTSIDAVEIEFTRSGIGLQSYGIDNFQTLDTDIGDPGAPPSSAVPEPTTITFMAFAGVMIYFYRRRVVRHVHVT
jgi:hypothetical protein